MIQVGASLMEKRRWRLRGGKEGDSDATEVDQRESAQGVSTGESGTPVKG